jgi:murein L,D-transpeptidase YcbB/YkuD
MTDLSNRRALAETDLAELERDAGAALLDGADFDPNAILAARGTLSAIDAAEAEAARRAREAEEAEAAKAREQARIAAGKALVAYQAAVTAAEAHSKALVASLADIVAHGMELRALARPLGIPPLMSLDRSEQFKVLSDAVATSFAGIDRPRSFGRMNLPSLRQTWAGVSASVVAAFQSTIDGEPK